MHKRAADDAHEEPGAAPRGGAVDALRDAIAGRTARIRLRWFNRLTPVSDRWGYDRGLPVDRFYIADFLGRHRVDIRGHVLEIGDSNYTRHHGGGQVTRSDVLHVDGNEPGATIVGDLADLPQIEDRSFDAIILTQTLHLIYDMAAAMRTVHRILRPGGVCLLTVPGITRIDRGRWGNSWFWSLTPASAERLAAEAFGQSQVEVSSYGNVLSACAFLQGCAAEDVGVRRLTYHDPCFPVIVAVRATRAFAP
ncbi:MAG TPA: methyltransferase domain-containing protein [Acidimicrobiales bacterium]|jgi:SAM-dependent methyltransferase|nr:methyltransferase domain-containing protein [Acidimicrobiales bacterium]